jgi:hypothetical protein
VSWDPYLDLQTGVLRNRLGITETATSASRAMTGVQPSLVIGAVDFEH